MIDIISIYQKYNIKYWDSGKNVQDGWVNIQCKFCDDKSNHLGFNLEKQYYFCWKCGKKFNDIVFKKLNIPLTELNNHSVIQTKVKEKLKKIDFKLPGSPIDISNAPYKYLANRNFDPGFIINKYQLRYCNHLDLKYKFRIIIPIIYNNEIISFTSRDYTNRQKLRYVSCPKEMEIIEHKTILYNFDNCKNNYIIVVEGIFDCWRLGDNCCATFGISYTKEQINLLTNFEKIFICFDNEKQAQIQAVKLGELLSGIGKQVFIVTIPEKYKDLAEMPQIECDKFKQELLK